MCLAMPAQVVRILGPEMALVNLGGVEKEIVTVFLDHVDVGDYVIIHVGHALTKLDEDEAQRTLRLFKEIE